MKKLQERKTEKISFDDLANIKQAMEENVKSFESLKLKDIAANRRKTLQIVKKIMKLNGLKLTVVAEY